ncbi:MAG: glycosyltransferase [Saccharofermentans sp.]|nr:glycosyltransferase [Saccharofermentans sp.]
MKTIMYIRANGIYSDSRATKEILTFLKAGYSLILVGWDREGNSENKCKIVFDGYQGRIKYSFYDFQVKDHVGFKNINKLYNWLKHVKKTLLDNQDSIYVVHACNLDTVLLCYKSLKKLGIKLVYDIFDYYVDGHASIPGILRPVVENCEISIINRSDVTIICTEERREQIAKANPSKVIVIHNTPEVEFLHNEIKYDYFYCGTFCIQRLIEEILDEYKNNTDLVFGFAGYGLYKDKAITMDNKYENFTYLGQVMYSDCLDNESRAVCLSAIYEPTIRNHRLCAPNKFYESLALGKPQIVCKGTGIDRIVEENQIGIVIDYDVKQFYSAVRYLKSNPDICDAMGKRARVLYENKYNWEIMSSILLEAYASL